MAPEGDMYDLSGHWHPYRTEKHREAIKTTMSAMWFKGWPKSFPKGGRKGLPKNVKVDTILEAIKGSIRISCQSLGKSYITPARAQRSASRCTPLSQKGLSGCPCLLSGNYSSNIRLPIGFQRI